MTGQPKTVGREDGTSRVLFEFKRKKAQQSVQWICGSLRGLQAFFWLRFFSAPEQSPRPPQRPVTQTVSQLR